MQKENWCIYIVRCADGSLYTGTSTDVVARVATHNAGKGAKYTRSRLPVSLVYSEEVANRSLALVREAVIKKMSHQDKAALAQLWNEQV